MPKILNRNCSKCRAKLTTEERKWVKIGIILAIVSVGALITINIIYRLAWMPYYYSYYP